MPQESYPAPNNFVERDDGLLVPERSGAAAETDAQTAANGELGLGSLRQETHDADAQQERQHHDYQPMLQPENVLELQSSIESASERADRERAIPGADSQVNTEHAAVDKEQLKQRLIEDYLQAGTESGEERDIPDALRRDLQRMLDTPPEELEAMIEQRSVQPSAESGPDYGSSVDDFTSNETAEALEALQQAGYDPQLDGATTPETGNQDDATAEDRQEELQRRRAMAMSPSELAASQRLQTDTAEQEGSFEQRQQALNELVLSPGILQTWREGFQELAGNGDEGAAEQYVNQRLEQIGSSDLASDALREQLRDFMLMSENDFQQYEDDYDEAHGYDRNRIQRRQLRDLPVAAYVNGHGRAQEAFDRYAYDENGERRRWAKAAAAIGGLAVAGYLAYRFGETSGAEDVAGELGGEIDALQDRADTLEQDVERQTDILEQQGDVIAEQQDAIDELETAADTRAETDAGPAEQELFGNLAGETINIQIPEGSNVWSQLEASVEAQMPDVSETEKQRIVGNLLNTMEQQYPGRDLDLVYPGETFSVEVPSS